MSPNHTGDLIYLPKLASVATVTLAFGIVETLQQVKSKLEASNARYKVEAYLKRHPKVF